MLNCCPKLCKVNEEGLNVKFLPITIHNEKERQYNIKP